ncbi:MAG: amino acid lyase [Acidobacteria bacterium]|nr:MAG: amino acid lyase [Acidobacteriota bacterium]RPJ85680.1 MAG: amino acid lyase [Acidobacteriota bacterium]
MASMSMRRRTFLKSVTAPAVGLALTTRLQGQAAQAEQARRVLLTGDGLGLGPLEYCRLLERTAGSEGFRRDSYLHGGPVEALEQRFAAILGKEAALFLPTGTLANHLAVRVLAGERRKVLVQADSHFYRDEGDCGQLLSGLNLVPLGAGRATLGLEEVTQAVAQAAGPPYPAPVGALSIESPVRRLKGQVFDFAEMKKVCAYARQQQIGLHLDGARMFLASAYTGVSPAEYSAPFDAVYVSLYKYFNAPFGAILAGPATLMERVSTLRHQFGSLIYQGWETAAVALHYLEGFGDRYAAAARHGESFLRLLEADRRFRVERVEDGSNVFGFALSSGGTLDAMRDRLAESGIFLGAAKGSTETTIQINETITRRPPDEIARAFGAAV